MATATKKPTTIEERISHLGERIEEHRAVIAGIEAQAAKMDEEAQAADARAAAILSDFTRPAEGLAEDVQAHKNTAAYGRDGAQLLRQRAAAYRAANQLDSLETEHRHLTAQMKEAKDKEAGTLRHATLVAELEARRVDYGRLLRAKSATEWRLNDLGAELDALSRRWGLTMPSNAGNADGQGANWKFPVQKIEEAIRWEAKTTGKAELMAYLPKLDS